MDRNLKQTKMRLLTLASSVLLSTTVALADHVVTGSVVDAKGEPMTGVTIMEAGSKGNGTVTDLDGKFKLKVSDNASLSISYIGYISQTLKGGENMKITLREDNKTLDDVVVIGYGVQKKSDVTGSIASVKAEDLANRSITTVDDGLQGKTSGVQVISTSGAPGAGASIRVRGYSSNSDSTPLYVVDGLRTTNINYLDPADIESMEVLKDAASAAIYGAQAGNGVVLITTKKAKKGIRKIAYDMSYSIQKVSRIPKVLNAKEYINWVTEGNLVSEDRIKQYYDGTTDTNWADVAFEDGSMQRHNVSFQGSNSNGSLYASLAYNGNNGPIIGKEDIMNRLTGTVNSDYKVADWAKFSSNNSFARFHVRRVREGGMYSMLGSVMQMDPLTPVTYSPDNLPLTMKTLLNQGHFLMQDENGNYYSMSPFQETNNVNPYIMRDGYTQRSEGFNFRGTTALDITPWKFLTFTSRISYDFLSFSNKNVQWPHAVNTDTTNDFVTIQDTERHANYWQWENFLNYNQTFGKHAINAMVGMSYDDRVTDFLTGYIAGTNAKNIGITKLDKNYLYFSDATGTAQRTISGGEKIHRRNLSYYGRVSYNYGDRYFIQASLRADAADLSILPLEQRWGYFPAVSGGWTISNESFFKKWHQNVIDFVKLRASWGQNGSISGLGNYMYASNIVSTNMYPFAENGGTYSTGSRPSATGNDNLKWETSEQTDFGLDLRFFKSRLTLGMDYYIKKTKNLIMSNVTASMVVGNTISPLNAGDVKNTGFELDLGWRDNIGDFSYSISGNLSTLHNEVTYIYPTLNRIASSQYSGSGINCYFEKGHPVWYMRGYKYLGVNPENGYPQFQDTDKDGQITDNDKVEIGSGIPKLTYGITLTAAWKGIDLRIFGNGTAGNDIAYALPRSTRMQANTLKEFYDNRWTENNRNAKYVGAALHDYDKYLQSSAMVFDGSYFKIKQIQLGYTLPKKLLGKTKFITSCRIYAQLEDFFTFTSYPGFDPEVSLANDALGIDYGQYPSTKKITFGLSIAF